MLPDIPLTASDALCRYSYSKTRGLFGGISLEGSVIVERQDANAQAYRSDVTAKMLLSGAVPPPEWAQPLIGTLDACTGMPGGRRWVQELNRERDEGYIFGGTESPRLENGPSRANKRPGLGSRNNSVSSYFDFSENTAPHQDWRAGMENKYGSRNGTGTPEGRNRSSTIPTSRYDDEPSTEFFETRFESDFIPEEKLSKHRKLANKPEYPFGSIGSDSSTHRRSVSAYTPSTSSRFGKSPGNPFETYNRRDSYDDHDDLHEDRDVFGAPIPNAARGMGRGSPPPPPKLTPKAELSRPLQPHEGVARAIALFDFNAVQVRRIP